MAAKFSWPPSRSDFSHRVTVWPRWARRKAASHPAGPPPTTRMFFRWAAGGSSTSSGVPHRGLARQVMGRSKKVLARHPWLHPIQGRMTSSRSSRAFRGQSGSVIRARPRVTRSPYPRASTCSAVAGRLIRPPMATGMDTASRMALPV